MDKKTLYVLRTLLDMMAAALREVQKIIDEAIKEKEEKG